MSSVCGAVLFRAPEVYEATDESKYTNKCDVWSFGVTLFFWSVNKSRSSNRYRSRQYLSF